MKSEIIRMLKEIKKDEKIKETIKEILIECIKDEDEEELRKKIRKLLRNKKNEGKLKEKLKEVLMDYKERLKEDFVYFFEYEDKEFLKKAFDEYISYFLQEENLNKIFENEYIEDYEGGLVFLFLLDRAIARNYVIGSKESKVLDEIDNYIYSLFMNFKRGRAFMHFLGYEVCKFCGFFDVAKEINLDGTVDIFPGFEHTNFYFIDFLKFEKREEEDREKFFPNKMNFVREFITLIKTYITYYYSNNIKRIVKEQHEDFTILRLEPEEMEILIEKIKRSYDIYKGITDYLLEKYEGEGVTYRELDIALEKLKEKVKEVLFKNF